MMLNTDDHEDALLINPREGNKRARDAECSYKIGRHGNYLRLFLLASNIV